MQGSLSSDEQNSDAIIIAWMHMTKWHASPLTMESSQESLEYSLFLKTSS